MPRGVEQKEANVCTSYEVPLLDPERTASLPIGKACTNTEVFAVNSAGEKVTATGESGELYVRGPSLMQGAIEGTLKRRRRC